MGVAFWPAELTARGALLLRPQLRNALSNVVCVELLGPKSVSAIAEISNIISNALGQSRHYLPILLQRKYGLQKQ